MRINAELVKRFRAEKHWSQEQLATACDVNIRTIQRIENQGTGSLESVRALASVFNIDADDLLVQREQTSNVQVEAVKSCLLYYANFEGTAGRAEYWWFFLFALLVTAVGTVINQTLGEVVLLAVLLPLLAVGCRRLRDSGQSGWWQLLFLLPFGFVVVFYLLAAQGKNAGPKLESA